MGLGTDAAGIYQQRRSEPGLPIMVAVTFGLLMVFGGFVVYWLITGSWTIGRGGRMTNLGTLVWIGPVLAAGAVLIIGPRGWLRLLWKPRLVIRVDKHGITRIPLDRSRGREETIGWAEVSAVRVRLWEWTGSTVTNSVLVDPNGTELASLPLVWSRIDDATHRSRWHRSRDVRLPDLAVAVRPDRYRVGSRFLHRNAELFEPPND